MIMKKVLVACCFLIFLAACSGDKDEKMVVSGEINGLKKGTLYLQKQIDSTLVVVDSVALDGASTFELSDKIESPEVYYLTLDNNIDRRITFFGDAGEIIINTKLDKFVVGAEINGQRNQQLLDEYAKMMKKFRDRNLDLIKADFETRGDTLKQDSLLKLSNNLLKRRYFYTTNFAVKYGDSEIAPFLALTELYNANISLLDTINNSLTEEVKTSKYGKQLEAYIAEIKAKK